MQARGERPRRHDKERDGVRHPLTFQTLSGNPVTQQMFELLADSKIGHIELSDRADQVVIAPATANIIGKIAGGIADDFLTTMVMATRAPVLVVPSMNTKMWENPIVQANVNKLRENGYLFMEPASGDLACGWQGKGRLPGIEEIVERMEDILTIKDLAGEKVLVTAGPTAEPLTPYAASRTGLPGRWVTRSQKSQEGEGRR